MAPPKDGKHSLPLAGHKSPRSKRTRSVYFVESPGGTWRKTSPTKTYRAASKLSEVQTDAIFDLAESNGPLTPKDDEKEDDDLRGLSVKNKLVKGISMGQRRSDRYRANLDNTVAADPQLQLLGPPSDITTTAGLQKSVDRACHVNPDFDISCCEQGNGKSQDAREPSVQKRV